MSPPAQRVGQATTDEAGHTGYQNSLHQYARTLRTVRWCVSVPKNTGPTQRAEPVGGHGGAGNRTPVRASI